MTTKKKTTAKPKTAAQKRKATLAKKNRQTGATHVLEDKKKKAKKPGKRVSATGKVYYERRANRSDVGKLLGVTKSMTKLQAQTLAKSKNKTSKKFKFSAVLLPASKGGNGKQYVIKQSAAAGLKAPDGQNIGDLCIRKNADGSTTTYNSHGGNRPCPYGGRPKTTRVSVLTPAPGTFGLNGAKKKLKKK